jgi:CNT family concentrative nucleoside transporter
MPISLLGIIALLGLGWLCSRERSAIRWRTVGGALALQIGLGAFVLGVPWGKSLLEAITNFVSAVIGAGYSGISFLFGPLLALDLDADNKLDFVFALQVLPVIIFFSSLISVLYYLGVMRWVINILGGLLQRILGTSRTESLSATANIFVGQTEAPLVVKPYIPFMNLMSACIAGVFL